MGQAPTAALRQDASPTRTSGLPRFDRERLVGAERTSVPVVEAINARPRLKSLISQTLIAAWAVPVHWLLARREQVVGFEPLARLRAPHGIVLVANHRTYFDMFVCTALMMRKSRWATRLHFPVRTSVWYDTLAGLALNLLFTGGSMWPPIFRDKRRRHANALALRQLAYVLGPGAVVGIHPEGTRNTDPDPWHLMPAQRGVGEILSHCHPEVLVVPFFVTGMTGRFFREVRDCLFPAGKSAIRLRFGAPVPARELVGGRTPQQVAENVMSYVAQLAAEDRAEQTAKGAAR